jgi:lipopolysaccharide transport system permease protein
MAICFKRGISGCALRRRILGSDLAFCHFLYGLNPMVGIIEGFRYVLLGGDFPQVKMLLVSVCTIFLLLIGGLFYFQRLEENFADIV